MRLSANSTRKGNPSVSRVLGRILLSGVIVSFPATLTVIAQQTAAITVTSTIKSEAISEASEFESSDDANLLPAPADEVVPNVDREESKAISTTFLATAYCLKGQTASGVTVRRGIIAADPKVLPLGSVVRIQAGSYSGIYTVMDTGGAIKGRKIDIYIPTRKEAIVFGARKVKVEVLRRGWEPEVATTAAL
ncbi:MAG: 3D domain-containing protein [Blastocatellia bacterium]|jgi:3D (Asp-Asp-Asp) domain-containing protein|nr:3D domain-containing protein [Blastocatellia bacterium]MBK6425878.1 3D domain-containing protein [Blastocatellia bacterium]